MIEQINKATKKYFTLGNFFIYTVLIIFLMSASLITIEVWGRFLSGCKPSKIRLAGDIDPGLSKAYDINYQGGPNCYLIILPSETTKTEISLWLYQPYGKIQVMDGAELLNEGALVLDNLPEGKYRVSIHNRDGRKAEYDLAIYLASN